MKPLILKMSAFGPFADEVEIPFYQFDSQGLFLITGNTGAGKTTIFDAISFALYGNTSGITRTVDMVRSDFTSPESETYVYLEFLHKGKKYIVKRNPQYLRPKKSGTGMTFQSADAVLTYPDGRIETGIKNVTNCIEELLCIDWKQFKQLAMIAQGEFLNLILANGNERGAILRKVFNTQKYADMQKNLKEMASSLKRECEESDNTIIRYLFDISFDENNDFFQPIKEWRKSPSVHSANEIIALLEKILIDDKNKVKTFRDKLNKIVDEISKISVEYELAKVNNDKLDKRNNLISDRKQMLGREDEIRNKKEQYTLSQRAVNTVKPFEDKYIREKKERNGLIAFIEITEEKISKSEKKIIELMVKMKQLEENLPLAEKINVCIKEVESQINLYNDVNELNRELGELQIKKKEILALLCNNENEKYELEKNKNSLSDELKKLEDVDERFLICAKRLNEVKQSLNKIKQMLDEYNDILEDKKSLEKVQNQFLELERQYKIKNEECNNADAEFMRAQAGIMASNLKYNEQCPVCGSTTHPCKAKLSETLITEAELKKLKEKTLELHKAVDNLSHKCGELKTRYDLNTERLNSQIKEIFNIETDSLDIKYFLNEQSEKYFNEWKELKTEYESLLNSRENKRRSKEKLQKITEKIDEICLSINSEKAKLNQVEIEISKLDERLKLIRGQLKYSSKEEAIKKIEEYKKEYIRLKSEFEVASKEYNDCNVETESLKAVLANNKQKLIELEKSYTKAQQDFIQKLRECGFEDEKDYHNYLISDEELHSMNEEINNYENTMRIINERIAQLENETKDLEIVNLQDILNKKEELIQEKTLYDEVIQSLSSKISNNSMIYSQVSAEMKSQNDKRNKFMLVDELSKTANGELAGKQKLAFEHYIQAFYFERILHEANKRLKSMTDGRYELLRKEEASDNRINAGLEIDIMDYYTGKIRSAKSLSGGEAFKASLSLALGLSDVIQSFAGGIEVDTMFIDEGFGALDSESLESAITTLNTLTEGNRLVGVISHVESLKEKIEKKIIVLKGVSGSTIKCKI